jgi:hypothetical protein
MYRLDHALHSIPWRYKKLYLLKILYLSSIFNPYRLEYKAYNQAMSPTILHSFLTYVVTIGLKPHRFHHITMSYPTSFIDFTTIQNNFHPNQFIIPSESHIIQSASLVQIPHAEFYSLLPLFHRQTKL